MLLFAPFLQEPLERDEGAYGYAAQVLLDGGVPYRDSFDHKPPLVYFIYAVIVKIAGPTLTGVRLFTLGWGLLAVLAVGGAGWLLWGRGAGLAAAFLYALFSGGPLIYGTSANTETFMVLPLLLALLCFICQQRDLRPNGAAVPWLFLAGLFSGLAVMLKQTAVFNMLVFLPFLLRGRRGLARRLLQLAAGAAVVPLLLAAYFAVRGAWSDFFYCTVLVNKKYLATVPGGFWTRLSEGLAITFNIALLENAWLWIFSLLALGLIMRRDRRRENILVVLWGFASLLAVTLSGLFLGHYYIQVIPALCLLSAYGIVEFKQRADLYKKAALIFLCHIPLIYVLPFQTPFYLKYSPERISELKYKSRRFAVSRRLAQELQGILKPEDTIFVWAANPELYFYLAKRAPTRYFTYLPWMHEPAILDGIISDVTAARPDYFIWTDYGLKSERLSALIEKEYRFFLAIDSWKVFKRR